MSIVPTSATVETKRLTLRHWRPEDREPFAALNRDPEVMEYFPSVLSREESDELVDGIQAAFAANRFGLWALEVKETGDFVGFTGLSIPRFDAIFMPTVEVGWRLARRAWGNGYATEAAHASLREGFERHGLAEIVSFTYRGNMASRAVMERLSMIRDPIDDFDHPALPGHRVARHVLYRMPAERWSSLDR